ncbi:MAG: hypothetical protein C4293_09520 [Nitrospiraceae bacterium]
MNESRRAEAETMHWRCVISAVILGTVILVPPEPGYPESQGSGEIPLVDQKSSGPRDDEMLASKLEEKLRMDERINWQLLEVNVKNGQVTLRGVVKTPEEQGLATRIVMSEPGVKAVDNTILVHENAPESEKKPDPQEKDGRPVLEGEGQIKEKQILP